ncbi:MAG: hypothetical protein JKY99_02435, partial [Rhizobiales bacterium]|nr:hypothetical protein [Hyphomicrobiales bacterium]
MSIAADTDAGSVNVGDMPAGHTKNNISIAYQATVELVSFLSSEGMLPDAIATTEFFDILEKARQETLTPQEEFVFWNGYSQLAKHAQPTQVDALQFRNYILGRKPIQKATEERYRRNLKSMTRIRVYSLVSFGLTLLFLTYLSLSGGYMANNDRLAREYRLIASGIYNGTRVEGLQEAGFRNILQEDNVGGSEDDEGGSGGLNSFAENDGFVTRTQENAFFKTQRLTALSEIVSLIEHNTNALRYLQFSFDNTSDLENSSRRSNRFSVKDLRVESLQKSINRLLSSYFLPVFTSLLGVTVYILRRTSTNINSGQYRLYESGTYSYRITLGIVGGIVISWFSTTEASGISS